MTHVMSNSTIMAMAHGSALILVDKCMTRYGVVLALEIQKVRCYWRMLKFKARRYCLVFVIHSNYNRTLIICDVEFNFNNDGKIWLCAANMER